MGEAQHRCSAKEFIEWVAYDQISPWGPERSDMRAALMPYTFASAFAGKGRKPKFEDYILTFSSKPKQTAKEMFNVLKAFATHQNRKADKNG